MHENELTGIILDTCINIHKELGPGLLESVYEKILIYEFTSMNLKVTSQVPIPVFWKSIKLDVGFRADLIVEDKVVIELKSIELIAPVHKKILLTYLRIAKLKVGMLINFNEELIKNGVTRIVNNL